MRRLNCTERAREWVVDYSAARAKAIEWLGERYLLARPVKRRSTGQSCGAAVRSAHSACQKMPGGI